MAGLALRKGLKAQTACFRLLRQQAAVTAIMRLAASQAPVEAPVVAAAELLEILLTALRRPAAPAILQQLPTPAAMETPALPVKAAMVEHVPD